MTLSAAVRRLSLVPVLLSAVLATPAHQTMGAAGPPTLTWAGHLWTVSTGAMADNNLGSASNVFVDAGGALHLRIAKIQGQWRCAELFTRDRLGFGTYQWQVEGRIDKFDPHVVLGLFPYGPAAGIGADGTNEIDVEYSRWGHPKGPNADWAVYPASGSAVGKLAYPFRLHGTYTTSRFTWTNTAIRFALLGGFQPIGSRVPPIKSWTYAPARAAAEIPQAALPIGMNLWLFEGRAPADGQSVSVVIHAFRHVPLLRPRV